MRNCIILAARTLTVLVLVVGLPLLALPPVRTQVSDWMEDWSLYSQFNSCFAQIGATGRQSRNAQTEDDGICWQAGPNVHAPDRPDQLTLARDVLPPSPRKFSSPLTELSPTSPATSQAGVIPRIEGGEEGRNPSNAQIQTIRQTLIRHGAQYLRLDEIKGQPTAYQFSCLMPVSNHAAYCRHFATTDSDPIRAMTRVLDEVERWQSGRPSL